MQAKLQHQRRGDKSWGDGSVGKLITLASMRTDSDSQDPHKKEQTKTRGLER